MLISINGFTGDALAKTENDPVYKYFRKMLMENIKIYREIIDRKKVCDVNRQQDVEMFITYINKC